MLCEGEEKGKKREGRGIGGEGKDSTGPRLSENWKHGDRGTGGRRGLGVGLEDR